MTNSDRQIAQWVEETPFVDTHEHLIEESQRLSGVLDPRFLPCYDWVYLFETCVANDLFVAGMPAAQLQSFLGPDHLTTAALCDVPVRDSSSFPAPRTETKQPASRRAATALMPT
ncbi:hypothetical protein NKH45_34075 [Mesorhizobium sp. M1156]|uniref:hypothetical protein n=1 Tax=Mesorhizobium sp. M1156 TaxID=2957064 RepID=UPI0033386B32